LQEQQAQKISDLEARLNASEVIVTSLENTRDVLSEEVRLAKAEKEEVEEKLKAATQRFEEAEGKCEYLKKKLSFFQIKAARYFKQLSFLPWLRDHSWARGFNWGFEAFRTLVLNPQHFTLRLSP
jgi:chromosome segregation ATPase